MIRHDEIAEIFPLILGVMTAKLSVISALSSLIVNVLNVLDYVDCSFVRSFLVFIYVCVCVLCGKVMSHEQSRKSIIFDLIMNDMIVLLFLEFFSHLNNKRLKTFQPIWIIFKLIFSVLDHVVELI